MSYRYPKCTNQGTVHLCVRNVFEHDSPQSAAHFWRYTMKWQTPAASDMRFGFEITMYIANR